MKHVILRLAPISVLAIILSMVLVAAFPGEPGSYVEEHIVRVIIEDDPYVAALVAHEAEVGGIPRVTDFPAIWDAGYQTPNEPLIGYAPIMLNNRLYPFDRLPLRQAVNRLVDKDYIIETFLTRNVGTPEDPIYIATHGRCDWWLPPGQAAWINYDCPAPHYNPAEADAILDAAGYIWEAGNEWRTDPTTGEELVPWEFITCWLIEEPVGYTVAQMITEECVAHGLPVELHFLTLSQLFVTLMYPPLDDWQITYLFGLIWTLHDTVMYDFFESTQQPLWNIWGIEDEVMAEDDAEIMDFVTNYGKHTPDPDESRLDWWCHEMKLTLDDAWMTKCMHEVQEVAYEYEPYNPVFLWLAYTCHTGDYPIDDPTEPGMIGIVNAAAYGSTSIYNDWGMLFERGEDELGYVRDPRIWLSDQPLNTLNPLISSAPQEAALLNRVVGTDLDLTPYYQEYVYLLTDGKPVTAASTFQVGFEKQQSASDYEDNVDWITPENAYASDDAYAVTSETGAHVTYKGFNFPSMQFPTWHVTNVEVGIEATGEPVDLEVFNGTVWTNPVSPVIHEFPDEETLIYVDVTDGATWNDLSQLKVRITYTTVDGTTTEVDYLKVRVKIAPEGYDFGETVTGMYVDYKLRPGMTWNDWADTPITSADVKFTWDLCRFQDQINLRSQWENIYKIDMLDSLTVRVWYVDQYVYRFEELGNFLNCPKHIWEPYIGATTEPLYEPFQDAYHDFWIDWDHHHSEWRGWENQRSEMADYPGEYWTDLIGAGPFVYPHGGLQPTFWRALKTKDFVGSRICDADVDVNGICDMRDVFQVLYRLGAYPVQGGTQGTARWMAELYSMQGPSADIAPPAGWIGGEEIVVLKQHFGHKWLINNMPVLPPPCG